jgi:hypothetical protein
MAAQEETERKEPRGNPYTEGAPPWQERASVAAREWARSLVLEVNDVDIPTAIEYPLSEMLARAYARFNE